MKMLEQYYRIGTVAGISIRIQAEETPVLSACTLSVEKNQLHFDQKTTAIGSFEALKNVVSTQAAIALNLSGKGILTKRVSAVDQVDQGLFATLLPNSKLSDFYVQHFSSGSWSFVSVIRKAEADKWLDRIRQLGYRVYQLSLGPFPVEQITDQLNIYGEELAFDGHRITRNEGMQWLDYRYDPAAVAVFPLKVDNEPLDDALVLAYATAFQLLLSDKLDVTQAGIPELAVALAHQLKRNRLKAGGFLLLAVLFAFLMANLLWLDSLTASNEQLALKISSSVRNTSDAQDLDTQIKAKESLLKQAGWEGGINKSRYIDQLAQLLPEGVIWKEISIDPPDIAAGRLEKSTRFMQRTISIRGESENISPVNEWIERLKTKRWIKHVQMESYTYNVELLTGQFTVLIDY
jgi:Tfp pilus assembly protein PilN